VYEPHRKKSRASLEIERGAGKIARSIRSPAERGRAAAAPVAPTRRPNGRAPRDDSWRQPVARRRSSPPPPPPRQIIDSNEATRAIFLSARSSIAAGNPLAKLTSAKLCCGSAPAHPSHSKIRFVNKNDASCQSRLPAGKETEDKHKAGEHQRDDTPFGGRIKWTAHVVVFKMVRECD